MYIDKLITNEHGMNLPTVRIKSVRLYNFKSVGFGEVVFNCGRRFVPFNTESDILGLYGQNGSGKTALIEALAIMKEVVSAKSVSSAYADCIAIDKEYAKLEFTFDLQYEGGIVREADYSFCIKTMELTQDEIREKYKNAPEEFDIPKKDKKIIVFNEKYSLLWEDASRKQPVIDTSSDEYAFIPDTKRKILAGGGKKVLVDLAVNKKVALAGAKSFVFNNETLKIFNDFDNKNVFFRTLLELYYFADRYLFVVDTKSSGIIRLNFALPIFTRKGLAIFDVKTSQEMKEDDFYEVSEDLSKVSSVLEQLVPGLSLDMKKISDILDKKGEKAVVVELVANRNGLELPLRDESDGVRKIISVLSLIIAAFNEQSVTVAIDEFDAGIFEYLLGEILQALEESGKGQFIFTSHNLRPLEVINKKFLYFTTTNPNNRYIRLKNVLATNNLRDMYFREIVLNEQDEQIYNRTKKFKIVSALKKARGIN